MAHKEADSSTLNMVRQTNSPSLSNIVHKTGAIFSSVKEKLMLEVLISVAELPSHRMTLCGLVHVFLVLVNMSLIQGRYF